MLTLLQQIEIPDFGGLSFERRPLILLAVEKEQCEFLSETFVARLSTLPFWCKSTSVYSDRVKKKQQTEKMTSHYDKWHITRIQSSTLNLIVFLFVLLLHMSATDEIVLVKTTWTFCNGCFIFIRNKHNKSFLHISDQFRTTRRRRRHSSCVSGALTQVGFKTRFWLHFHFCFSNSRASRTKFQNLKSPFSGEFIVLPKEEPWNQKITTGQRTKNCYYNIFNIQVTNFTLSRSAY